MAKQQTTDVKVRLLIEGFEGLDKIKSSFRDLGKVTNLAEKDILKARASLLEIAKESGNTEAVTAGLISAFKGLRTQTDQCGDAYKQLSADLRRLNEDSRGATDSLMAQRQAVLSTAAATTQNVAALNQQRDALVALRAQTRESSQAFEQFSGDIQRVETRLENLAEVNRRFNRAITQGTAATAAGAQVSLAAITQGISLRRAEIAAIDLLTKEQRREAENVRERIRLQRSLNIALTQQGILQFQESARAGRERVRAAGRTFNSGTLTAGALSPEGMADRFGLGGQIPNTTAGLNQELSELSERLINTYRHTETYLQVQLRLAAVQREAAAATQGYGAALRAQLDTGTLIPSQKNLTEVIGQLRREMLEVDTTTTEGAQAYANNARQADQLQRQLRELASAYRQVGDMATTAATAEQNAANARIRNNYLNRGAIRQQEQALRELGEQVRQGVASTPLLLPAAGQTSAPGTGQARSGGARNRLVDAAVNEFVDGVEATFSESLARRLKTAGERSGYYRPPTAAVGVEPAVGFAPGAAQAFDNLGRSTDRARRPLREVFIELQRVSSASNGSVNSLQAQINSWTEIRSAVSSSAPVFAKATRQIEILSKQRDRLQVGGGRRLTGMQAAQGVGAAISGGIFGGPEGLLGGLGGLAVGGVGGAFAGAAAGAQLGMFRQQIAATGEYAASIGKMQIALRGVAGSQDAYDTAIRAAAAATRELNIPQEEATRGLTRLSAAVLGAGGTMGDATFAFRSISEAIKATGGNAEQVDGALLALTQVFSKGKVSAEELNQIAERLPGTFTLFAQAAGKTGPELQKALQQGEVGLIDLMKFLDLAGERFGGTALKISGSSEEAGARLTVAFQAMRLEVGRAVLPLGAELQEAFAGFISDSTPAIVASVKAIADAFSFFTNNTVAAGIAQFALKVGLVAASIKLLNVAVNGAILTNIAGWFAGAGAGAKITGDYAAAAVPKVTRLFGALKALAGLGIITVTIDIYAKNIAAIASARAEIDKLKKERDAVGETGPKLVMTAERRYTGASREKVLQDQQAQQEYVASQRAELEKLQKIASKFILPTDPMTALYQQRTRDEIELRNIRIKNAEEVLDLELKGFKTQAQLDAARRKSMEDRFPRPSGDNEQAEKNREKLRDAFNKREDAMLEAREQREEKLADIRVQAAEQAKQIEQDLADTRRSLERELDDMARNRAYAAEDSERRIRGFRGEDPRLISAEQEIADIFRESRETAIANERRFSDEQEDQDRKIAEFQENIAKGIREANDAHTKKMGDIQKQYAKEVAKIVEKGGATSGKSIEQGGTAAAKQLAVAAQMNALYVERTARNMNVGAASGFTVSDPLAKLTDEARITTEEIRAGFRAKNQPIDKQTQIDLRYIESIDEQLKILNKQLSTPPKAAPAAGPSSSAGPNRKPNQNGVQSSLPGEVPLSFDVSKAGQAFGEIASTALIEGLSAKQPRASGIGDQFTTLLGAEGGYEDVAMTRGQAAIIIKKLETEALRKNISADAFVNALDQIGGFAQSPDKSRSTIRNLMATPGAGIAVRSPGLLRNLATKQLSQDEANIKTHGVNPASLNKQIEPLLAIISQLQKDNLLRKDVSLNETREGIQKPLYGALMDWIKANINNQQLQEIIKSSLFGQSNTAYGAKGLLPMAAGFEPKSFGVNLTPSAQKEQRDLEQRMRYEATSAGRAERALQEEYARKFRESLNKLGPRSEADTPEPFDVSKLGQTFGDTASAALIEGLLAQQPRTTGAIGNMLPNTFPPPNFNDGLGAGRGHQGQDAGINVGDTIHTRRAGKVVGIIEDFRRSGQRFMGSAVDVKYDNGEQGRYGHVQDIKVQPGQSVAAGQQLGTVFNDGQNTHLHYELRNGFGKLLDPLNAMKESLKVPPGVQKSVPLAVQRYVPASVAPAAGATTQLRDTAEAEAETTRVATQTNRIAEAYAQVNEQSGRLTLSLNEQLALLGSQRKYLDEGFSDSLSRSLASIDESSFADLEALNKKFNDTIAEGGEAVRAEAEALRQAELNILERNLQTNIDLTKEIENQNNLLKIRQDDRIGLGMQEGVQSYLESIGTMREATQELTVKGIKGLEDSIYDLVTTGTTNFREFAANILRETARMIIQQLVMRNILMMVKNAFSGVGFADGGVFGGDGVSTYAKGGAFSKPMGGTISTYAKGGMFDEYAAGGAFAANKITPFAKGSAFSNTVVSSPTLFKFASGGAMQTGLMGEAGPEAVLPLKRGPDGRLGVTSNISGANTNSSAVNNVTVNVDASGSKVQGDSNKSEQLGRAVSQAVQEELVRQKLPGGLLS